MKRFVLVSALAALVLTALPTAATAANSTCALTPSFTEGPYYLSSTPVRSNIIDGQAGTKITLRFTVQDSSCKPIKGARVDVWYANANGEYSGVENQGDDLGAGKNSGNFLRGTQYTNAKGVVTFTGIYPGWYPARTVHIHEKVWVGNRQLLTTQTYFTDQQNASIMKTSPYNTRGTQRVTNSSDMLLRSVNLKSVLMNFSGSIASATFTVKP